MKKLTFLILLSLVGCSHTRKAVELNSHKRVALVEIEGPKEARNQLEVSLINRVIESGDFELVDQHATSAAKSEYPTKNQWPDLGRKVDADYLLSLKVTQFNIKEHQGLDRVQEEDSLLAQEQRDPDAAHTTNYKKVKTLEGLFSVQATFFDVKRKNTAFETQAHAEQTIGSTSSGMRRLQLLEKLSNKVISDVIIAAKEKEVEK
ncbi:MAG: hypothetical protein AB7F43_10655 [Bacteriovoracia bacterium]